MLFGFTHPIACLLFAIVCNDCCTENINKFGFLFDKYYHQSLLFKYRRSFVANTDLENIDAQNHSRFRRVSNDRHAFDFSKITELNSISLASSKIFSPQCSCDGITDDTNTVQVALDLAGSTGTVIFDRPMKITRKITADAGIRIRFEAEGVLRAYTHQALEIIDRGKPNSETVIENLRVEAGLPAPDTGLGFGIKFSGVRTNRPQVRLSGIQISSVAEGDVLRVPAGQSPGFDKYIWINNVVVYEISNITIRGNFSTTSTKGFFKQSRSSGLVIDGQSTDGFVRGYVAYNIYQALLFTGSSEGLFISDLNFVGVYNGIVDDHSHPGVIISSGHINALRLGISLKGSESKLVDVNITDILIYRSSVFGAFALDDDKWEAIIFENIVRASIKGVQVSVQTSGSQLGVTAYGFVFTRCQGINVNSVQIAGARIAISHKNINSHITYDGITFNGLGLNGIGLNFSREDSYIYVGSHYFLGSVGTKYNFFPKRSIYISGYGTRYGSVDSPPATTKNGSLVLKPDISPQHFSLHMDRGALPYKYSIELESESGLVGDILDFHVSIAPNNPTFILRDKSTGATLLVQTGQKVLKHYVGRATIDSLGKWRIVDWHESLI